MDGLRNSIFFRDTERSRGRLDARAMVARSSGPRQGVEFRFDLFQASFDVAFTDLASWAHGSEATRPIQIHEYVDMPQNFGT